VYRFGAHNNYSNTLALNINTPATCRVLSTGTPVPASRLHWYYLGVVSEDTGYTTGNRLPDRVPG